MPLDTSPYDALLLVSFGGPEKPEDVVPFLENVTRGRGIPRERLEEVGEHYFAFGGRSPINDQNRAFIAAVEEDFRSTGIDLPVYWGNRNWHPFLADTLRQMRDDGVRRAACLVTSAYSSYSGCRQYRENLADAVAAVGAGAPRLDRLRHYFNHPGFVEPMVDATLSALADLGDAARRDAHVLFVTHSVPESMNATSGPDGGAYVAQHRAVVGRGGGAGPPGDRAPLPDRAGVLLAVRAAARAVAGARRQRPHRGARPARGRRGGRRPDRLRLRPHGGHLRPRHRGRRDGREGRRRVRPGRDGRASTRGSSRWCGTCCSSAPPPSGAPSRAGSASGRSAPSWDVCPVGCCPNPRGDRPALCGRD